MHRNTSDTYSHRLIITDNAWMTTSPLADAGLGLFRALFEQSPTSMQVFAPDGTTLAVNAAWELLWQSSHDDILAYNILADRQLEEKGLMPLIRRAFSGEHVQLPPIHYRPNETLPGVSAVPYRWVRGEASPLLDADGNVAGVVLTHHGVNAPIETDRRERQERFRLTFEEAPIGIAVFTLHHDGTTYAPAILHSNRTYRTFLGYSEEELEALPTAAYTHRADLAAQATLYDDLGSARRAAGQIEQRYIRKDGTVVWGRLNATAIRGADGGIVTIALVEDITDRRRAEEALRTSEERLRTIFEEAPVGISLVDPDGRYIAVNPARRRMLGYDDEDLAGRHYLDFTHPDDIGSDRAANRQASETGFGLEKRFVRRDGSVIWNQVAVRTLRDEAGEVRYSISIAEDVTERKEAEAQRTRLFEAEHAARRHLERLAAEREAVLGQIAEGVIIADPDGRLVFINDEARRIYGVAELGVRPEGYSDAFHVFTLEGEPYPSLDLPLARAIRRGEVTMNAPLRIKRPDGAEVIVRAAAKPVRTEDGALAGAVLTVRDTTDEYDVEQQKDDFLSAAAHDLRTPLTSVKGRVQLLRRRAGRGALEQDPLIGDLDRIEVGLNRMTSLIGELLDVANIQIGRPLTLHRGEVDLAELARNTVADQQNISGRHEFTVSAEGPIVGRWDISRLERALANLLSNAIKYSPQGGEIAVEVRADRDTAILSVADRGIGIPTADLPHVFDRFHRGGNAAGKIPGTGIGLAAVRDIVSRHGGSIEARNRPGGGAIFTIRLPLQPPG